MNIKRAWKDFLHVIEEQAFIFVEIYELLIDDAAATTDYEAQLFIVIERFRLHIYMRRFQRES